ncbi:hypothetical protein MMC20_003142 [Loxospora ochrophaea]|nr:hypothetical protein [Loxospora ochrophaea]
MPKENRASILTLHLTGYNFTWSKWLVKRNKADRGQDSKDPSDSDNELFEERHFKDLVEPDVDDSNHCTLKYTAILKDDEGGVLGSVDCGINEYLVIKIRAII